MCDSNRHTTLDINLKKNTFTFYYIIHDYVIIYMSEVWYYYDNDVLKLFIHL